MIESGWWPQAPRGSICFQCGKPATAMLPYYQGGKGWVQRPVCEMGDAHPWDVWVPAEVPEPVEAVA